MITHHRSVFVILNCIVGLQNLKNFAELRPNLFDSPLLTKISVKLEACKYKLAKRKACDKPTKLSE